MNISQLAATSDHDVGCDTLATLGSVPVEPTANANSPSETCPSIDTTRHDTMNTPRKSAGSGWLISDPAPRERDSSTV